MNGKAPVAILTTFENTKFPSVSKKIKNLVTSREEALAAHELARSRMWEESNWTLSHLRKVKWFGWAQGIWRQTIRRRWLQNKKDCSKLRRCWDQLLTYWNSQSLGKSTKSSMPHCSILIKKQGLWRKLYPTTAKEEEEVYKVEQILKHRKHGWGYEYLIKWVSYLITKASWEPKSNLTSAMDILQEYQELHQL
jgi:Chromo (CHRromatin Organisation MOdifier) domain